MSWEIRFVSNGGKNYIKEYEKKTGWSKWWYIIWKIGTWNDSQIAQALTWAYKNFTEPWYETIKDMSKDEVIKELESVEIINTKSSSASKENVIDNIFNYSWYNNIWYRDYFSNISDLKFIVWDRSSSNISSIINVEPSQLELDKIEKLWLEYYSLGSTAITPSNLSVKWKQLFLDSEKRYYFKFKPNGTSHVWYFGISNTALASVGDYRTNSKSNYLFWNKDNNIKSMSNQFYANNWTPYSVSGDSDILNWILDIKKGLFIVWPANISFEDFYKNNLVWN